MPKLKIQLRHFEEFSKNVIYIRFRSLQNIWIFPPKIVIFENSKMLQNETFWRFLPIMHFTWFFLPIFYQFNGLVNWSYLIYDFLSDHCNSLFWAKSTKPKVPRVCHHRAVAKNKDVVPAKKLPLQPLPVEIMSWNQVLKTLLWIQIQPKIYPHKSFWKTKGKKVWNISNYKREQRLKSLQI